MVGAPYILDSIISVRQCSVYHTFISSKTTVLLLSDSSSDPSPPPPPMEMLRHLALSIESEIMDRFWSSRCLNDCLQVLNKIGTFASSATSPLVVKSGTKLTW